LNHFIAVKSSKLGRKNTNKISEELYKEVQKRCRSVSEDNLSSYNEIIPVVSMRTTYSNRVVTVPGGQFYRTYDVKLEQGDKDLYSLSMISSKQFLIESMKKTGEDIPESILKSTIAYPIGIAFIDNKYYLLSHIVIDDLALVYPEFSLNEGFSLSNISSINSFSELESSLQQRLLIIKEEDKV
jgi:hypothetical protein